MKSPSQDHYAILGVASNASDTEIRKAFRKAAMQNHPDRVGESGYEKMAAVNLAQEVLLDPVKRAAFDRELLTSQDPFERAESTFSQTGTRPQQPRPQQPSQPQSDQFGDRFRQTTNAGRQSPPTDGPTRQAPEPEPKARPSVPSPTLPRNKKGRFKVPAKGFLLTGILSIAGTYSIMLAISVYQSQREGGTEQSAVLFLIIGLVASMVALVPAVKREVVALIALAALFLPVITGLLSLIPRYVVDATTALSVLALAAAALRWRITNNSKVAGLASSWDQLVRAKAEADKSRPSQLYYVLRTNMVGGQTRALLQRHDSNTATDDILIWGKAKPGEWIVLNHVNQIVAKSTDAGRKAYYAAAFGGPFDWVSRTSLKLGLGIL